jgi:hypothetical protein
MPRPEDKLRIIESEQGFVTAPEKRVNSNFSLSSDLEREYDAL